MQPTYAAAKLAADRIHRHLASDSIPARSPVAHTAAQPNPATLAALIDAAFWTSLRREEGYIPRIRSRLLRRTKWTMPSPSRFRFH